MIDLNLSKDTGGGGTDTTLLIKGIIITKK